MCFGLGALEHLFIWIVVVVAVFAIIRVLLSLASPPQEFVWIITATTQIVKIVLWAAIIIAVGVVVFELLACIVPVRL